MVRTDIAVEAGLDQRLDDLVHIERAAAGQVRALLKRAVVHDLDVAHVHKADALLLRILAHHLRDVVELRAAQRAGAQAQRVGRRIDDGQVAVQICLVGDNARQAKDRIRGIVRMQSHHNAAFLRDRNDLLEENFDVLPQALFAQLAVGADQVADLVLRVAGVPAGQIDVVLERVQTLHLIPVHDKAGRAVRRLLVQLGAGPVEYRHEVVGDALDAVLRAAADVLAVNLDVLIALVGAEFDVLGYWDGFDHVEHQPVILALLFHLGKALLRPDLARLYVIDSRNDRVHARDLGDVLQRNRIGLAIPTKRHFHIGFLLFIGLCRCNSKRC